MELGNAKEALAELDRMSPEGRKSYDSLLLEWQIWTAKSNWLEAHRVAEQMLKQWSGDPQHWLFYGYALRRIPGGGLPKAWETLLAASEKFPGEPVIAYNLACYACQLGWHDKARAWLFRALEEGPKKEIKEMALRDSDLEPLREEIKRL